MAELGVCVAPSTILRRVVRYSVDFAECWRDCERAVGRSWRCDETYIKVGGQWPRRDVRLLALGVNPLDKVADAHRELGKHYLGKLGLRPQ